MKGAVTMLESKVIFHIDNFEKWKLMLNDTNLLFNSKNIEKCYIEVLATSEAVKRFDCNEVLASDIRTMKNLITKGVKFVACNHSLKEQNVNTKNIMSFVDIVPTGALELINRQGDGYIYLPAW
jgi:intracellular sulfur oxidation DsrE/DsrF family protein